MNIIELRDYCQKMIDNGWDCNVPVKFREKGRLSDIDCAVMSNDAKNIVFAEEWL
jgi:hypothetical protein